MTLKQLAQKLDWDKVRYQELDDCISNATQRKRYVAVTFSTNAMTPGDLIVKTPDRLVGIILWIPQGELNKARSDVIMEKEEAQSEKS